MKKDVILQLDTDLVEKAEKEHINISRLTEEALRQALEIRIPRTAQEHLQKMLAEIGREDSSYGETYFLPFQIERLKLTNVGPFENFEATFKANSINVIHGLCGSGKSTIIRSILYAFGIKHKYFTKRVLGEGTIEVKLFPRQDSIKIRGVSSEHDPLRGYQCLLADDSFERIPKYMIPSLFAELKRLGIQVILTTLLIDVSKMPDDICIITIHNQR
ncbi:MAG: AAA family ATPase [Candidatus Bathyarchaeales archaeon]